MIAKLTQFMSIRDQNLRVLIFTLGLAFFCLSITGLAGDGPQEDFDVQSLVEQISKSRSIGMLTKLSLLHDSKKLLKSMRDYHAGNSDSSLEQLHERYDVMLHKLTVVVQKKNEELAKAINAARDDLWVVLADAEKFALL